MSSIEMIKRKINELEERADIIEYRVTDLIESLTIHTESRGSYDEYYEIYYWVSLTSEQRETRRKAIREYEGWYSAAYQLIKDYLPERTDDLANTMSIKKAKVPKTVLSITCNSGETLEPIVTVIL
jgi:hypothetical protein